MTTMDTKARVSRNRRLSLRVPEEVTPGEHHVVLIIDPVPPSPQVPGADIPVISVGRWPQTLSLRREDVYGDDGR